MIDPGWIVAAAGGAIIGLASSLYLLARGHQVGISGMVSDVVRASSVGRADASAFLAGLVVAGLVARLVSPAGADIEQVATVPVLAVAGLLVGFGTRLGGGCTSGHGVSGISRLSPRSIVATLTFIALGALVTFVIRRTVGA